MSKKTLGFVIMSALIILAPYQVNADSIGGHSALLSRHISVAKIVPEKMEKERLFQLQKKVIRNVLEEYDSPLAESTDAFIENCRKYDLDCYFLPSIAGLESYFGEYIWPNSHNPFGWARGYMMFESWDESIDTVAEGLKENYIDKGAVSVEEIGVIYSESPTWAARVRTIMRKFIKEEKKQRLYFTFDEVQL